MTHKEPPIKIIHCFRSPIGGLFRHVCDLVRGQAAEGLSIGVVYDSSTEDANAKKIFDELSSICSLGIKKIPMSRTIGYSDILVFKELSEFYKDVQPDILHGHGAKGGAYVRLVAGYISNCQKTNLKAVYTPHGGSLHYKASSPVGVVYLGIERLLKKKTQGLIFESQFSADIYKEKLGSFPCKYKIIHNGLKEEEFQGWSDKKAEYDFVFVGELRMLKGIDVLLQAVTKILKSRSIKVLIVGAGPDEEYFRKKVSKSESKNAIKISPPIFPATEAFKLGHCVVMPSLAESFPYVVLEGLAAGCPLITTRVGGIPEIYGPYEDDLIPAGVALALEDALIDAMENHEQKISRTREIQSYVKDQFGLQRMLDEVKFYYDQILELDD